MPEKFCARNTSSFPSPSKSATLTPKAGANCACTGIGRASKRSPRFRKTMESDVDATSSRAAAAWSPSTVAMLARP